MDMAVIEKYVLILFPVFFITLWCFIIWIFSHTSGWRKLAARFHESHAFEGTLVRFQSARLNLVNFNNVLHLGLHQRGMYLVPMILFRPFHKPLFIPWEEIVAEPNKRFLFRGYQLHFRSVPGVRLELYQTTFQMITDYLKAYPDRLHFTEQADG
jgi:hypothetical protein